MIGGALILPAYGPTPAEAQGGDPCEPPNDCSTDCKDIDLVCTHTQCTPLVDGSGNRICYETVCLAHVYERCVGQELADLGGDVGCGEAPVLCAPADVVRDTVDDASWLFYETYEPICDNLGTLCVLLPTPQ